MCWCRRPNGLTNQITNKNMTPSISRNRVASLVREASGLVPAVAVGAAGGAALLVPNVAEAAVFQSSYSNVVIPATTDGIYFNVETGVNSALPGNAPGWDINPWATTGLGFFSPNSPSGGAYVRYSSSGDTRAGSLDLGTVINSSSSFSSVASIVTFGSAAGQWDLNSINYFGFRFTAADAQVHYGYGAMQVGASATVRTLVGTWYESTPGVGITVTAVPEPEVTAAMFAAGAGALAAFRRMRRSN